MALYRVKDEDGVPLETQAVATLRELHALTGNREYVFPGRDPKKPMSEAAVNAAIRRMGYDTKTEITGHGFRAMARTILDEQLRFPHYVIEHQLAHKGAGCARDRVQPDEVHRPPGSNDAGLGGLP